VKLNVVGSKSATDNLGQPNSRKRVKGSSLATSSVMSLDGGAVMRAIQITEYNSP
jgi:hypothetical protein